MFKRNFNGGGWREAMTSNAAYGSTSGSTSGSSSNIPDRGRGQSSNQQADKINQAREDRRNQVQQAQQDERDWAGEFSNVPVQQHIPTDRFGHELPQQKPYDWTKTNYGGVSPEYQDYLDRLTRHTEDGFSWYEEKGKTWEQRRDEQLISAFGGITGEWDPLQGLSDADRTALHDQGEFPWPPPGGSVTGGGGGGGGWGDSWGSGGGGGYGGGGGGGYGPPEKFMPRGQPGEQWGQQNPLQQAMINIHGGQGFQQGFSRGGIVSLVT